MTVQVSPPLVARVIMAMPMGPPFGGMTSNAAILRRSEIFRSGLAELVDTTPPPGDYTRLQRVAHSARMLRRLLATVRAHRADVVFFSSSSFAGFYEKAAMALACRRAGAKTVVHLVGSFVEFHASRRPAEQRLIAWSLGRFDRVLVVSEAIRAYLLQHVPMAAIEVVPNPVACEEFPLRDLDAPANPAVQILFAGAIIEAKGVLDLLAAIELARDELDGARFEMIGDGPLLETCRNRIEAAGLASVVAVRGFVDDSTKKALFRSSDVFVLPSHFEAMPISVLEASSSGIAVIATDVGAIRSVIDDGVSGLIVPPKDPASLARALVRVIDDPDLRRTMSLQGATRVRSRFDAPIIAGQLIDVFNALHAEASR